MKLFIITYEGSDWNQKAVPVWCNDADIKPTPEQVSEWSALEHAELDEIQIYGPFRIPEEV